MEPQHLHSSTLTPRTTWDICSYKFTILESFDNMFVCDVCERLFEKSRHLRLHKARNHVAKSEWKCVCQICQKVYADDEILQRHIKTHSKLKSKISCPVEDCRKEFIRKAFLDKHVTNFHPDVKLTMTTDSNNVEKKDTSNIKKLYCCKKTGCSASFNKHHLLTQHSYVHTKILPFKCSHCDKLFLNLANKNKHEKIHKGYTCEECQTVLPTWTVLRKHNATVHRKEYKCEDCKKVFFTLCRLSDHAKVHSEERQVFQCRQCDRNFTRKHALKVHLKVVHEGVKDFKCTADNCLKSFAFRHSLLKHVKKCHSGDISPQKKTRSDKINAVSRILGFNTKKAQEELIQETKKI